MERFTVDFSAPNFFTIGLIAAFWFVLVVGGYNVMKNLNSSS